MGLMMAQRGLKLLIVELPTLFCLRRLCAGAHHWAWAHDARIITTRFVIPYAEKENDDNKVERLTVSSTEAYPTVFL